MSATTSEQVASVGMDHYIFVIRRQWRIILALTVLGAGAAVAYLAIASTEYTATTSVNLNVISTDPFNPTRPASGMLDNATEVGIAQSASVATLAAEALPGLSATQIRAMSEVTLTSDTTIATVTFTSSDPAQAEAGADAVASAYLAFRGSQAAERIDVAVANLASSVDELNERLLAVNTTLALSPEGSAEASQATSERSQIQQELQDLLSRRNLLRGVDTTGGIVLSSAESNPLETAPSRLVVLGTGVALGLLIGVLAAFVYNPSDRRLRNRREMARVASAPVLANLASTGDASLQSSEADALRVARERVFSEIRSGTARLLVMDMTHDGGVSNHAANFAIISAQSQRHTLLIAPQVEASQLETWSAALGLDLDGVGSERVVRSSRVPWLSVYVPENAASDGSQDADSIVTRKVRDALADATPGTVCVFVLTSSAHAASVLAALRESDAAVLLTRSKSTLTTEVSRFVEESTSFAAPLLGVLTASEARRSRGARGEGAVEGSFNTPLLVVPEASAEFDGLEEGLGHEDSDRAASVVSAASSGPARTSRHRPKRASEVVPHEAD